jgi:hypothetical protein
MSTISDKSKKTAQGILQYFTVENVVKMMAKVGVTDQLDSVAGNDPNVAGSKRKRIGYQRKKSIGDKLSKIGGSGLGAGSTVVLNKIYKLMANSYETDVRRRELAKDREEENKIEEERNHKELLSALQQLRNQPNNGAPAEKPEKDDTDETALGWIKDKLKTVFGWIGGVAGMIGDLAKFITEGTILGMIATVVGSAIGFVMSSVGKILSTSMTVLKWTTRGLIQLIKWSVSAIWSAVPDLAKAIAIGVSAVVIGEKAHNSYRELKGEKQSIDRELDGEYAKLDELLHQTGPKPGSRTKNWKTTRDKSIRESQQRIGYLKSDRDVLVGKMEVRKDEGDSFSDMVFASMDEAQYGLTGFSFMDEIKKIEGYADAFSNLGDFIKTPSFDTKSMKFTGGGVDVSGLTSKLTEVDTKVDAERAWRIKADKNPEMYRELAQSLQAFGGGRGSQGGATAEQMESTRTTGDEIGASSSTNSDYKFTNMMPKSATTETNTVSSSQNRMPVKRPVPSVRNQEPTYNQTIFNSTEVGNH